MGGWQNMLAAALRAFAAFLQYLRARRAAAFRARAAADGSGVLLDQLNPRHDGGHAGTAGADQSATSDARRNAGRVDG